MGKDFVQRRLHLILCIPFFYQKKLKNKSYIYVCYIAIFYWSTICTAQRSTPKFISFVIAWIHATIFLLAVYSLVWQKGSKKLFQMKRIFVFPYIRFVVRWSYLGSCGAWLKLYFCHFCSMLWMNSVILKMNNSFLVDPFPAKDTINTTTDS